jgi:hypothetical protein
MCIISFFFLLISFGAREAGSKVGDAGKKKKKQKTNKTNGGMGRGREEEREEPGTAASEQAGLMDKKMRGELRYGDNGEQIPKPTMCGKGPSVMFGLPA